MADETQGAPDQASIDKTNARIADLTAAGFVSDGEGGYYDKPGTPYAIHIGSLLQADDDQWTAYLAEIAAFPVAEVTATEPVEETPVPEVEEPVEPETAPETETTPVVEEPTPEEPESLPPVEETPVEETKNPEEPFVGLPIDWDKVISIGPNKGEFVDKEVAITAVTAAQIPAYHKNILLDMVNNNTISGQYFGLINRILKSYYAGGVYSGGI